jgi:transcriptional regulator with XRE-family HTH domain
LTDSGIPERPQWLSQTYNVPQEGKIFVSELGKRIGQRIRELRTQRPERWTQEEPAERAQISVSFLSRIERGERVAHVETLAALASALGVSLGELFAGTEQSLAQTEDLLRPLSDFARARGLTARDVDRLLGVARVMFNGSTA